jgi:hypothetical protein
MGNLRHYSLGFKPCKKGIKWSSNVLPLDLCIFRKISSGHLVFFFLLLPSRREHWVCI